MRVFVRKMASNVRVVGDILAYLWTQRLWWLIPMVILLMAFGLMVIFASTSGIGPFIYTLF